jgi:hypothetical protein
MWSVLGDDDDDCDDDDAAAGEQKKSMLFPTRHEILLALRRVSNRKGLRSAIILRLGKPLQICVPNEMLATSYPDCTSA